MLPVVVLVGRPNVGKSTLFNVLTQTRRALVADMPGVTRDRQYGSANFAERQFIVVDTGGIVEEPDPEFSQLAEHQVKQAIEDADYIFFMVDAKAGCTPADEVLAQRLRAITSKVTVVVNKTDSENPDVVTADFMSLGFGEPIAISAKRKSYVADLITRTLPENTNPVQADENTLRLAVVGRPNVGKSTLINRMLGEDRVIVADIPGTTRDSIFIPFERHEVKYTLIDTAGVRRRTKVKDKIEKFSVIQTMQAVQAADVVIVLFSVTEQITDQDLRLVGKVLEAGRGVVLAFNQWDAIDAHDRQQYKADVDRRLEFIDFARRYYISALHGTGVGDLFRAVQEAYESLHVQVTTPDATKLLERAQHTHQPPLVRGRRVKPRFAHVGGHYPLTIVIHGKQVESLPGSYKGYLENYYRKALKLVGVPILISFKNDDNPYADKK